MRRLARQLPAAMYPVAWEPGLRVPAADGTTLITDHYRPVTGESCPTLLLRSPYGRGFPFDALYGVAFAEQGFHVVIQSCRGTGGSAGTFRWCHDESADGLATVAWLRRRDWFNGSLGTVGPSYFGYTQLALAAQAPPELKAAVVQVGMHRPYDGFYPGGVFALETALIGGIGTVYWDRGLLRLMAASTRLQARYRRVTRSLPLIDAFTAIFGDRLPDARDWLTQTEPADPYWKEIDLGPGLDQITAATALIGGWYDILLDQTIAQYQALRANGTQATLLIGPWTHTSLMNEGGTVVFGDSLAWLRQHLADGPGPGRPAPVRVYVGGADQWRDLPDWPPPAAPQAWYLDGDRLGTEPPATAPSGTGPASEPAPTTFRYDPADPTPSVGGRLLSRRPGPRDNGPLEARPDVVTFTSLPLPEPLEIVGAVRAELHLRASGPGPHVFVRLCDVDPAGRSRNVCDGIRRLALPAGGGPADHAGPAEGAAPVIIEAGSAAYRLAAGHRLRLQVSGGAFPRFARNTGTAEPLITGTRIVPTDISIYHDAARPSVLRLPVLASAPDHVERGQED